MGAEWVMYWCCMGAGPMGAIGGVNAAFQNTK
jgi:hypothetical protein